MVCWRIFLAIVWVPAYDQCELRRHILAKERLKTVAMLDAWANVIAPPLKVYQEAVTNWVDLIENLDIENSALMNYLDALVEDVSAANQVIFELRNVPVPGQKAHGILRRLAGELETFVREYRYARETNQLTYLAPARTAISYAGLILRDEWQPAILELLD